MIQVNNQKIIHGFGLRCNLKFQISDLILWNVLTLINLEEWG